MHTVNLAVTRFHRLTHLKLTTSPTSEKMSFSCSSVASYGMFPTEIIMGDKKRYFGNKHKTFDHFQYFNYWYRQRREVLSPRCLAHIDTSSAIYVSKPPSVGR